jgi:transcriptional regulator GlxA family with amidase domain
VRRLAVAAIGIIPPWPWNPRKNFLWALDPRPGSEFSAAWMTRTVSIIALDRCVATAVAGVQDSLWAANLCGKTLGYSEPFFNVSIATPNGEPCRARGGIMIQPDSSFAESEHADVIIVPPLMANMDQELEQRPEVTAWLRERAAAGVTIVLSCNASFLRDDPELNVGVQRGTIPVVTGHFEHDHSQLDYAIQRPINQQGDSAATGAPGPAFQFALRVIERFCGPNVTILCTQMFSHTGTWLTPLTNVTEPAHDRDQAAVWRALSCLEGHAEDHVDSDQLARMTGLGSAEFSRHFRAAFGENPTRYLCRVRVAKARRLLESSNQSVEEITRAVGYENSRSFIRLFRRHVGMTPLAYRKHFRSDLTGGKPEAAPTEDVPS